MEERIIAADPVADPQGYQRELLALLGTSDPVEVLAATPATIEQWTMPLTAEVLDQRPAAGEWSVAELVGHLWDAEIAYGFRARIILTRDRAPLIGYDQEAWARLARPPLAELLAAFAALRTANLVLIRGTPVSLWDRLGIHEERAFAWPPRPSPAMTEPICCSSSRPSPRCRAELELPLHHPRPSGQGGVDRDNGGMA
jgi:DinB superfamily